MRAEPRSSRVSVLLAATLACVAAGAAAAEDAPRREADAAAIHAQVQACFTPSSGATQDAVVAFRLDGSGQIAGKAEIVERGDGPVNEAFAAAALRAVRRCAPYGVTSGPELRIVFKAPTPPDAARSGGARSAAIGNAVSVPPGFCDVDPSRGGYRQMVWTRLTPPRERNVGVESLAIDCETLAAADDGRPGRPRRVYNVYRPLSLPADAPTALPAFLSYFEARFSSGGNPVKRDDLAVYVAHEPTGSDGMAGASAYTLVGGKAAIVNLFDFTGERSPEAVRAELSSSLRASR